MVEKIYFNNWPALLLWLPLGACLPIGGTLDNLFKETPREGAPIRPSGC